MTFTGAITQPSGTPVVVIDIQAGVWCRAWILHSAIAYKVPLADEPTSVYWNGTTLLTHAADVAGVIAAAGTWFWTGSYLYVSTPGGASIWGGVVQAIVTVTMSNHLRVLNGLTYAPRVRSIPNLSQRIEAQFGGVSQLGGGSLTLINDDGYFDTRKDYQWDAREVQMSMAIDLPGAPASSLDYSRVATWVVSDWSCNAGEFTLQLKEPKGRIKSKIPVATYDRATYPNIDDDVIGQPIQLAYGKCYGKKPVLIDPSLKKFKVAGHAIFSFDGVRIKRSVEETRTESVTGFVGYSATTFRVYKQGPLTAREVRNSGSALTSKTTAAQVDSTSNSYAYQDGWLYVNPGGSALVVTWDYSVTSETWATSNFETTNLADGTFTLGSDWTSGSEVSVDFIGKPGASSGKPIETPPDIILELLTEAGITAVDVGSVNTANLEFQVGTASNGASYCRRCIGLYIDKQQAVDELIGKINGYSGTYTWTDGATGNAKVGAFWPKRTTGTADIEDKDIIEWSDQFDTGSIVSKLTTDYADRTQDGYSQHTEASRVEAQYLRNQPAPIVDDKAVPVPTTADAEHYAQRWSLYKSRPIRRFSLTLFWGGWAYDIGAQLYVYAPRRNLIGKFEVLERNVNLSNQTVRLVLGDMRGLGDSTGWWVSDAQVLPTSFASLTGYGAGSVTWNSSWDPRIKAWARANVGYWTDANGFANSSDPDSFIPSSWF